MDAARLVEHYRRGDFLFTTARGTVLAQGTADEITGTDEQALADRVSAALAERGGIATGVLPYDAASGTPARLVVPRTVHTAGPAHPDVDRLSRERVGAPAAVRAVPEPRDHAAAVRTAVTELAVRDLRKVVLARALDVEFARDVPVAAIVRNLVLDHRHGYVFAADLPGGRTLLGASPELLVSRRGGRVVAHPLAGSMPRSGDAATDTENAETLLASKKDLLEHTILTEAVAEALGPFCATLDVPAEPTLERTPAMWHLGTRITGELADPATTALHLASALHPTPAICGTPVASARRLIGELEPFDRGYYAGATGWVDSEGDGEWAVSIRCADAGAASLRMYAGGGIVADSDPHAELDETSAKFATLGRAMGLDADALSGDPRPR
ncbi:MULTISPECIES: isochorismate synthase [Prauserella salsuginis group]|uniref:isochorismate synthase n=1 Tax=Prauserella salsuginis TaxID=387889 RepID=A0ABW6GAP7_9PSEU|nr:MULTISPECIES: isochorismate synthase [Prauserella salsuginis group]MCR3720659.1 isochorismate synthase [Prauserella flava]MCR3735260.1 isochorismate synthase [Prauserella salsuginis]